MSMEFAPNQRVTIGKYGSPGTVQEVAVTAFGDEALVHVDFASVPSSYLTTALVGIDTAADPQLPLFSVLTIDGILSFQTPEPFYNQDQERESASKALQGLVRCRGYSRDNPIGEVGYVRRDSLMPVTPEQFALAKDSVWKDLFVPKVNRLADIGL